ncbi:uncharacterized protein LOC143037888 [Oratosquilla oratoria]|uniref:uncharacterized protein LOC143037888 n=1 Tax=Oratosquilla oratoria TaxID=337810 RepID=UPI003F77131B
METILLPRHRRLYPLNHHLLFLLFFLLTTQVIGGDVIFPKDGAPAPTPESLGESPGEDVASADEVSLANGPEDQVSDPEARQFWESDLFYRQKFSKLFGVDNEPKRPIPRRKVSVPGDRLRPPSPLDTRRTGVDRPGPVNVVRVPAGAPPPAGATPLGYRPPLNPKRIPVLIPQIPGGPPVPLNAKPLPFMTPPRFSPQHLSDGGGPPIQIQRVSVGHQPAHIQPQKQQVQQQQHPQVQTQRIQQATLVQKIKRVPQPQVAQQIPQLLKVPQGGPRIPKPRPFQHIPQTLKVPQPEGIKGLTVPKTSVPTASRPHSIQYTPNPHHIEHLGLPSGVVKLEPLIHTIQAPPKRVVQGPQKAPLQPPTFSKVTFPELEAQGTDFTFSQTKNPAQLSINLSPGLPVIPQVTVDSAVTSHDFPYPFVHPNLPSPTPPSSAHVPKQPPHPLQQTLPEIRPSKPIKPNSQLIKKPTSIFTDTTIIPSVGGSTPGGFFRQPSTLHPRPAPQPTLVFHSLEEKKPIKAKTKNDNFNPSPLEGSYSADAFQPIFVASKSLDNGFGKDDMIPISVPNSARAAEKAKAKAGPSKPEMLDFF